MPDETTTTPAAPPQIDLAALAREVARHLGSSGVAPPPKTETPPPAPAPSSSSSPTPEQRATLEERLSAAEKRAAEAQATAALEIWTRDVRAELADSSKGAAAVPDAMLALLRSEAIPGEDGRLRFKGPDGKPRQVYDDKARAFRDLTIAERAAELRAAYPSGFVAPPGAVGAGGPGRGTATAPTPDGLDLQGPFDALKNTRIGGRIDPELYLKAAAEALPRMAAHKAAIKQLGGN